MPESWATSFRSSLRMLAGAIAIILCGIAIQAYFFAPHDSRETSAITFAATVYPTEWLDERVTVEQVERQNTTSKEEQDRSPELRKPFGFNNARWEALKTRMRPGDELWKFASPADSWKNLAGRAGIALVRDGKMVDAIVTVMN